MVSEERTMWLLKNLTEVELKTGFNAIQTLLDLELAFTPEEQDDIDEALKRIAKL